MRGRLLGARSAGRCAIEDLLVARTRGLQHARGAGPARRRAGARRPARCTPGAAVVKAMRAARGRRRVDGRRPRRQGWRAGARPPPRAGARADRRPRRAPRPPHRASSTAAALSSAAVRPRVPVREAHRRRVAGLPREHVLRAGGVGLVAERHGDGVRDAAQVADERVEPERLDVPANVVQDRDAAGAAQPPGEVGERRLGRRCGAGDASRTSARSVHSASTSRSAGSSRNVSACSAVAVRRSSTTTSSRAAIRQPQALEQPRVRHDRIGPPHDDDLGAVADVAQRGRARPALLGGEPGRAVEQRARGIDHRADRLGQRHRGALRLARRLPQPVHERRSRARRGSPPPRRARASSSASRPSIRAAGGGAERGARRTTRRRAGRCGAAARARRVRRRRP